jgi:endonuclease/exonuclease/phosphatase family metal-dependent hydrolase
MSLARRSEHIRQQISTAAKVFSEGRLLPRVDVLALQEADMRTARSGGHHVAKELATKMDVNWAHEPAGIPRGVPPVKRQWWLDFEEPIDMHDSGDTGVALLSRLPLADVTRIDLPWHECQWRPRLAIAATISVGPQQLRLFNAHIDPHAAINGQLEQLEVVAAQAEATSMPTIILGDFNTLSRQKCIDTRKFLESQGYTTPYPTGTATWRGGGLRMHADWIFVRGVKIERWGVARPLNVSDHWPIWAEIVF